MKEVHAIWVMNQWNEIKGLIGVCSDRENADALLEGYLQSNEIELSKEDKENLRNSDNTWNTKRDDNYAIEKIRLDCLFEGDYNFQE
jgi:hypothetical protein